MKSESVYENDTFKEFLSGLGWMLLIVLGFCVVAVLKQGSFSQSTTILKISLSYGISIFSMVWLAALTIYGLIELREEKTGKAISVSFWGQFVISMIGLSLGAILAEHIKALFLGREAVSYSSTPFVILIGTFISLIFIFYDKTKSSEREIKDLAEINEELVNSKKSDYLEKIPAKIGNQTKVLDLETITYFMSSDHYTMAYTSEGEYIVEFSLKKLSTSLDPKKFIQIHRNCIVQLELINSIESGSNWVVKTKYGNELNVSRNNRKKLRNAIMS
ncbi:MAG: LytTR family transcriptional regulator [Bacteriovoracaceae bacterium]|jgi:DNA-binding LytR/AlgR family response regulator|nr:LytTR family transcriptional regulator [Bacteriovoracaceae bacterium]